MGRPPADVDGDMVRRLARIGSTQQDIADYFGVARATICNRFRREWQLGHEESKKSLRIWQFKRAKAGSDSMLIHLGKHLLNQRDTPDTTDDLDDARAHGEDGAAIEP